MQATEQQPKFVSLSELAETHGMPAKVLRRRIRRYRVPTFENPFDLRQVLLRAEDAAAIFEPRPIRHGGEEAVAA